MVHKFRETFRGTPLFGIHGPRMGHLSGTFGEEVVGRYHELVRTDFRNVGALCNLRPQGGYVMGATVFSLPIIDAILREHDDRLRVATPSDLELAIKQGVIAPGDTSEIFPLGLLIHYDGEPNEYLAGKILQQLRTPRLPVVIPFSDMFVKLDEASPHNIAFVLKGGAKPMYAPQLKGSGSFTDTNRRGLPSYDRAGPRHAYIAPGGASFLYIHRGDIMNWGPLLAPVDRIPVTLRKGTNREILP